MTQVREARLSHLGSVTLGKMIQSTGADGSVDLPYVRAAHIQPMGRWHEATPKTMPFSPVEARDLDIRRDDVLVVEGGAGFGRAFRVAADMPGWGYQNSIVRIRPKAGRADGRFLAYALQSALDTGRIALETSVATIPHFTAEKVSAFRVPAPALRVQSAVADFLDRETAKIDALIAKQEALTRSVLEHRDAVILGLITGGKGPAKREASGVDWIGDMPEHWETRPLRHVLASVETGVWGSDPAVEGEGTPCARVADFDRERLQVTDPIPTLREVSVEDVRRRGLRRGDLLIERSGGTQANPVGFVVSFESDTEAVCSNFLSRLRLQDGMNHRYWLYAFYAARLTRITEKWTKQTTGIQNLDFGGFSSEHFPCPPSSEQDEIVAEIDQLMSSTGAQLQRQRSLGQLLVERRAALITAAVTGRLDVTTYGKAG